MKHLPLLALFAVGAAGCSKKNENPTAAGTSILAWELAQSERASIRTAKTSDVKVQEVDYTAHPTEDTAVKVKVHLETATVVFEEDGKEVTHTAPIKLGLTLVDGADYTLDDGRCMGPNYKLAAPGEAPRDMLLHCTVNATKPNAQVNITIYAYGDGTINDGQPTTVKVR